jgi:hypothetical protein
VRVVGGDIHDNPGSAIAVRTGGTATVAHSRFARNATDGQRLLAIDPAAAATFTANTFVGNTPSVFQGPAAARAAFARNNWFPEAQPAAVPRPGQRGR